MSITDLIVRSETPEDADCLEILTETVFGPGMRARAAYFLREGVAHEMDLSFVAQCGERVIGTVRLTKVCWGSDTVLMLGPLAVLPELKGQGIGKSLMRKAVEAAGLKSGGGVVGHGEGGAPLIMLVGDLDYYKNFGFVRIPPAKISLPRPADPTR
ncbi:MAG: N-acetyltransferase, partial [Rhizobiaceae bacterium]